MKHKRKSGLSYVLDVLVFCLTISIMVVGACRSEGDTPVVSSVFPSSQYANETVEVHVLGEGFHSRKVRNLSGETKFEVDEAFTVKFIQEDAAETSFELHSKMRNGSGELVVMTSKDMTVGTYAVQVISPFGKASDPKTGAFRVLSGESVPTDGDGTGSEEEPPSDTGTGGNSDTETESTVASDDDTAGGTDTDTDADTNTDTDSDSDIDSDSDTDTDSDTDMDSDTDGDTDTDTDSDTDSDSDSDSDTDADSETDTNRDTETNTADESDTDTHAGSDAGFETCDDGVLNQDETGVDCGGTSCPPCGLCTDWQILPPEEVVGLETLGDLFHPSLSADGLTLYFAEWYMGEEEIYVATRESTDSIEFSSATKVSAVDLTGASDGTPAISADGLTLYFFSNRAGGQGDRDILRVNRADLDSSWGTPEFADELNSSKADHLPWLSADGLEILFVSCRNNAWSTDWRYGGDIWKASRLSTDDPFSEVQELTGINSAEYEDEAAALTSDGLTLYFSSDRQGVSSFDIYRATRADTTSDFSEPELVADTDVNSSFFDFDLFISRDNTEFFFSSNRNNTFLIYRSRMACLSR